MSCRRKQGGFMLLLMMLVLAGGSMIWLSKRLPARLVLFSPTERQRTHAVLVAARQALLSYSAVYATLYGPAGAGVGHLPCPDTDLSNDVDAISNTSMRDDGPNPPCGTGAHAYGQLPRHVNLPGHRYAFHSLPGQVLDYAVSSQLINNPVNRVVNPSLSGPGFSQPAVEISLTQSRDTPPDVPASKTVISYQALLEAARPAVAAWFVQLAAPLEPDSCTDLSSPVFIVSLLADDNEPEVPCDSLQIQSMVIERVSAVRHWFVRNQWHEWLALSQDPVCVGAPLGHCNWQFQLPATRLDTHEHKLRLTWQPVS